MDQNTDLRAGFEKKGFVVLRGLLEPAETARYEAALKTAIFTTITITTATFAAIWAMRRCTLHWWSA